MAEIAVSEDIAGSGGVLMTDHVICPACAHNFPAVSQHHFDRIGELEEALREAIDGWASGLDRCPSIAGRRRLDAVRAVLGDVE